MRFGKHRSVNVPALPIKIIKKNLSLYLSVLIRHSGAHMIWTFWPLFLQTLGADLFWVAAIQAINGATQFVFMYTLSSRIGYVSSVAGGLILVLMETLADFGAVSIFNFDTFYNQYFHISNSFLHPINPSSSIIAGTLPNAELMWVSRHFTGGNR